MTHAELVTISPDVMSGTPVFFGTRVPIQTLFDCLKAGGSIAQFLDAFPTVKREQVIEFLEAVESRIVKLLLAQGEMANGSSKAEQNPWLAIAGKYADDPNWDDYQAAIEAGRQSANEAEGLYSEGETAA